MVYLPAYMGNKHTCVYTHLLETILNENYYLHINNRNYEKECCFKFIHLSLSYVLDAITIMI